MHQSRQAARSAAKIVVVLVLVVIPLLLGDRIVAGLILGLLGVALLGFAATRFRADPTIAVILFLVCGLFVSPLGFAKPVDLFFAFALGASIVVHRYKKRMFGDDRASRLFVYVMCALYAASGLYSTVTHLGALNDIYQDLRPGLYLLVLPLCLNFCRADMRRWENVLRVTVALFSAISIAQFVAGVGFIGAVGDVETLGNVTEGITRVTSPANYFVCLFLFVALSRWLSTGRISIADLAISAAGVVCLTISFGRGFWYTAILGFGIIVLLARGKGRLRSLVLIVLVAGALAGVLQTFASSAFVGTLMDRFTSAGKEVDHGDSLGWRDQEDFYAIKALADSSPRYFLGAGVPYKPVLIDMDLFANQQIYIHNTYLGLLLKVGPIGLAAVLIYFGVLLRRILFLLKSREYRWIARAFLAGFIQFVATSVTQPAFIVATSSVVYFCFLAAGISVVFRMRRDDRLRRKAEFNLRPDSFQAVLVR